MLSRVRLASGSDISPAATRASAASVRQRSATSTSDGIVPVPRSSLRHINDFLPDLVPALDKPTPLRPSQLSIEQEHCTLCCPLSSACLTAKCLARVNAGLIRGAMDPNSERRERLQVMLSSEEVKAIDDFRFANRLPNRAAAIRDLLRRGLGVSTKDSVFAAVDLRGGRLSRPKPRKTK
jgi:DNA-binding transcriptional LysR family regulator